MVPAEIILCTLGSLLGVYVLYGLLLFYFQDRLIFQRPKPNLLNYERFSNQAAHLITIDGKKLQGWRIEGNSNMSVQLIYFGGNAQDVLDIIHFLKNIEVSASYTFNYRG